MTRLLLSALLIASPALALHIIDQATFPPGAADRPVVAVSLGPYTAIAYRVVIAGEAEARIGVQLTPTNPDTDELWPAPVFFGPGDLHQVRWSRDGFTLAYAHQDTVRVYQSDLDGVWDLADPQVLVPGGEILGLDLWGAPTDAAGHAVFLCIDDDADPSWDLDCRIHFASRSSYTGWTDLTTVVTDIGGPPMSQVTYRYGPAGPWPAIYFLANSPVGTELFSTYRDEGLWTTPTIIPGGAPGTPTSIEAEFDVARSSTVGILGLGPQPTCPCGTIHFLASNGGGWDPEADLTVPYALFDWPQSPRIDMGWNDVMHLFWLQRDTGPSLDPLGQHLEYRTFHDGVMTDAGDMFDAAFFERGIGWHLDVGTTPDGERSFLAWSKTDTIDGEPQLEQIFMARSSSVSAAPPVPPGSAVALAAWPNPFNPRVNLEVTLPGAGAVTLDVYDARGRHVRRVHDGLLSAGRHLFTWDGEQARGEQAPSGVYFAQAVTAAGKDVRKLVLAE